ncbi:MAG: gamma-glutamyltransferase family protein, partial [Planctomycetota bacterium]
MERRSFLKLAGCTCTSSLLTGSASVAARAAGANSGGSALVDRDLLSKRNQNRSAIGCRNGIVCSSQPLASMAGVDILKAGGNAVDAAVCANAMLSLVEPMMCGPGGDLFAMVWSAKERKLIGLNASGRAPYDWSTDKAKALGLTEIPIYGPLSWSVPGCVSGWAALQEKLGRFNLASTLEAPISYAREGFVVSPVIARSWSFNTTDDPGLARTFMPGGKSIRFGDIFKNAGLAQFLEIIAREGVDAFYKGQIAERIVRFSKATGGRLSMRDFRDHSVDWVEPVSANYRQGIAALQILNLLEHFEIGSMKPNSPEHLHLFIEAKKLAFEDRAVYYADMDFAEVPVEELISKDYARRRVKLI